MHGYSEDLKKMIRKIFYCTMALVQFRPHRSLNDQTPKDVYEECLNQAEFSNYACVG